MKMTPQDVVFGSEPLLWIPRGSKPRGIPFISQFLSKLWTYQRKVFIEEFTVVKLGMNSGFWAASHLPLP